MTQNRYHPPVGKRSLVLAAYGSIGLFLVLLAPLWLYLIHSPEPGLPLLPLVQFYGFDAPWISIIASILAGFLIGEV